jgi:hypothetical protein
MMKWEKVVAEGKMRFLCVVPVSCRIVVSTVTARVSAVCVPFVVLLRFRLAYSILFTELSLE